MEIKVAFHLPSVGDRVVLIIVIEDLAILAGHNWIRVGTPKYFQLIFTPFQKLTWWKWIQFRQ
jgi:hypothetical protein